MTPLRLLPRVLHVAAVLVRYRIDDLIDEQHVMQPLRWLRALLPRPRRRIAAVPRGARLRLALTELGPIWVKAGQVLSTRRDLIPEDVADELARLQDQVAPFPGAEARAIVEESLGKPIGELYAGFDETPLASASIAQVHAARLPDGREVVVKVLRPNIAANVRRNLELLDALARLVQRWHPQADKIRPRDMFDEVAKTLRNELNLQNEGANASLLRRNFENSDDLYVPKIFWSHTCEKVLTMERAHGIPTDDVVALEKKACACSTNRCSATIFSTPTRTPATSGSIPRAPATRVSSRWTSGSWARCRTRTSTGWRRTSSRCSIATIAASPSCISRPAGCPGTSEWTNWKPRCARCANRISRARCRKSRWPRWWQNCSAPRASSN
jgi:hypothetical protein